MENKLIVKFEFGGPWGAFFMVIGLPFFALYINVACNKNHCSVSQLSSINKFYQLFDFNSLLIIISWFFFQIFLSMLPVGKICKGNLLKTGSSLSYRCNGFIAFLISIITIITLNICGFDITYVYHQFPQFIVSSIIFSFLLAIYLYGRSFLINTNQLAEDGNTGNLIYDFFIGRELNPRIGALDLKFFCELRPGLIGWIILDIIFNVEHYQLTGGYNWFLITVSLFHFLYVADALWHEDAILTTMDILHDGFGLMLAFGDLTWVPFLYSLQARFLLEHSNTDFPVYAIIPIAALNMIGFLIFRSSNSQKNQFRKDPTHPSVSGLKTLRTSTGKNLLIEGWWGICRHPNYLGDLIMSFSWSAITGVSHIIPYFYPLYFLGLLVHRCQRDDSQCSKKYGHHWKEYCNIVPYRIFPYIY